MGTTNFWSRQKQNPLSVHVREADQSLIRSGLFHASSLVLICVFVRSLLLSWSCHKPCLMRDYSFTNILRKSYSQLLDRKTIIYLYRFRLFVGFFFFCQKS